MSLDFRFSSTNLLNSEGIKEVVFRKLTWKTLNIPKKSLGKCHFFEKSRWENVIFRVKVTGKM